MTYGLIVGCGIGGLATGLFMQQRGKSWPIVEQRAAADRGRGLLWIAPNGLHLLRQLGVVEEVLAAGTPQDEMHFSNNQLVSMFHLPSRKLAASNGFPIIAIRRRDLEEILRTRFVARGGEIHWGTRCAKVTALPDAVEVTFEGGQPKLTVSLLVAADGMHSRLRHQFFGASSNATGQGIAAWLGTTDSELARAYVGQTIESWGVGTRFVLTSLEGKSVFWSALARRADEGRGVAAHTLGELRKEFASYHPHVREILSRAQLDCVQRTNFACVPPLSAYHSGRVVLVGDSAHGMPPNMGQGASLALEDAALLSRLLSDHPRDVASALASYSTLRRRRVAPLHRLANSMNALFQPRSAWACALRDRLARMLPARLNHFQMARMYRFPPELRELRAD